jgi:hypothetical protein
LCIVLLITTALFAQDFSADLVTLAPSSKAGPDEANNPPAASAPTRFYASKDKVRFGAGGGPNQLALTVIADLTKQTTTSLFSWQSAYRITKGVPKTLHFFPTSDPQNACVDWQKIAGASLACQKAGSEKLNGQEMVKYRSIDPARPTEYIWVDPKLNFVVRWQGDKSISELRNVKEGPQDASLFAIPKDYAELKPQAQKPKAIKPPTKPK